MEMPKLQTETELGIVFLVLSDTFCISRRAITAETQRK
jgi:hypothetical protein